MKREKNLSAIYFILRTLILSVFLVLALSNKQQAEHLQRAEKEFELMIYPKSRHGVGGKHYNRLVVDFIKTVLELDD